MSNSIIGELPEGYKFVSSIDLFSFVRDGYEVFVDEFGNTYTRYGDGPVEFLVHLKTEKIAES